MPAVLDARHHLAHGRAVAGQLVRDHHSRGSALPLQQLAQQALGGLLVPPAAALECHDELKHRRHGPEREQVPAIPDRCMGNPSYPRYGTRFVIHL